MTPAGIEPATFRFLEQHLNYRATAVAPIYIYIYIDICTYRALCTICYPDQQIRNIYLSIIFYIP